MLSTKSYLKSRFRTIETASAVNLPFPIHPQIRLAQLSDQLPKLGVLKPFRPDSYTHLQGFRPNMLIGTPADLQRIAEHADLGTIDLSCVDQAVISVVRCGQPPLTDVARVVFWQVFGVPVFELFTGLDNAILAYECELHEGWHLVANVTLTDLQGELLLDSPGVSGLHTSLAGFTTDDPCPCGRKGTRLLNIEPLHNLVEEFEPVAAIA